MTKIERDTIEYASIYGAGAGADILLLCGADNFDGTLEDYKTLLKCLRELEKREEENEK